MTAVLGYRLGATTLPWEPNNAVSVFSRQGNDPDNLSIRMKDEKFKGWVLVAVGITVIFASIFGSLICLGIPSSIAPVTAFMSQAHPFIHASIGAGAILVSLIGIYMIYRGTKCFQTRSVITIIKNEQTILYSRVLQDRTPRPLVDVTLSYYGRVVCNARDPNDDSQKFLSDRAQLLKDDPGLASISAKKLEALTQTVKHRHVIENKRMGNLIAAVRHDDATNDVPDATHLPVIIGTDDEAKQNR